MGKKFIYAVIATVIFISGIIGYQYYQKIFGKSITKDTELFIYSSDSLIDVKEKISEFSKNTNTFLLVAAKKNLSKPKPGRYILKEGMSNNELVNLLRSGNQTPVKLSFNNQDTLEKLAGRIAEQLETDSISLLASFKDKDFLSKNNLTEKSVLQIFVPNSYQFYWTTSAENFRDKIFVEYNRFWNESRLQKAKALELSKEEVITLASIVQKETAKNIERPIVAGLYLNRLKKGWPLQADPTIIYSVKELKGQDYVVKRVLTADLEINSPYNTYKFKGLPPTLISMPDISSIDGVLNAEKHDYFYMCANVDKLGYHAFAKTLSQHNRNAAKYHQWMNKQSINR
ncbi:endolytic transglycosylase MltG [Polaribacter undariae]|uniref:Endolytic murein transglycosylase n=1 Tax=Polaribacter sejongensis TaxID=985043 RepID=A0AAJ1VF00_9FLAO|nr:endolytic transglycosylase MltG [Polaribacter undariae]MDN3617894.1 endolytic transglycosylase MltG [Polaribacter undariae]UWD32073.1 endolytic transglycosylase MltG [Polaribacter undariae]